MIAVYRSPRRAFNRPCAKVLFEGGRALLFEPGGPWEGGALESLHPRLKSGLLNGEIFDTMSPAQAVPQP